MANIIDRFKAFINPPAKSGSIIEQMKARYAELCGIRDSVNAEVEPMQKNLTILNEQVATLNAQANALAARIQEVRGGQTWIDLKKEIGILAKALSGSR